MSKTLHEKMRSRYIKPAGISLLEKLFYCVCSLLCLAVLLELGVLVILFIKH